MKHLNKQSAELDYFMRMHIDNTAHPLTLGNRNNQAFKPVINNNVKYANEINNSTTKPMPLFCGLRYLEKGDKVIFRL